MAEVDKESQAYLLKKAHKKAKKEEQTIINRKSLNERKQKSLAEKERLSKLTDEERKAEEYDVWKKEYDLEQERKEKGKEKTKKRHIERKKERAEEKTGKPKRKYVKKTEEEKEAIKSKKEEKQSIKDYNVSIPVLPEVSAEVDLPEFYAVEKTTNKKTMKKGKSGVKIIKKYKLVNPLTKQRNLAIRDGVLPITLKRKEVDKVTSVDLAPKSIPLSAFVKSDQRKVAKFNLKREKLDNENVSPPARPDKSAFSALERGRPEHLPKNIAWHQENGTSKPPKKIKEKLKEKEETKEELPEDERGETKEDEPEPPKKKRGRPKKYATEKERQDAKREQTLRSNKSIHQDRLNRIEGQAQKINAMKISQKEKDIKIEKLKDSEERLAHQLEAEIGGKGISQNIINKVKGIPQVVSNVAKGLVYGSTDYSPNCKMIIKKYGDKIITNITVCRSPVQALVTKAINMVSQGGFSENQEKAGYDKLYHLFLEIIVDNKPLRVEKNEVITFTEGHPDKGETEKQNISINIPLTFNELLNKGQQRMGDKYFKYDSANNNCQDYIMGLLEASSLGSPENYTFIKQNTKQLFEGLSKTRAIAKTVTNIGQKANIVMSGGAIEGNYLTASIVFPMSFGLPLAKKWLKTNHYKAGKPFIEGETWRFRQMSPLAIKKAGFNDYKTKIIENGIELLLVYKKIINGKSIMPKLVKGSKEAKDRMAKMRAMRKIKGGTVQSKEGEAIENVEGTGLFAGCGLYAGKGLYAGSGLYAGKGIDSDSDSDSDSDEPEKGSKIIHHHHHHHYRVEGGNILKDLKTVGKQTASVLIHKGIPKVASALGAMAGTTTGSPVGTFVGGVAGEKLGDLIAKKVGKKTGLGLKKGSQEAKDHMAKIRAMRK